MFHWFPALTQHETPCALSLSKQHGVFRSELKIRSSDSNGGNEKNGENMKFTAFAMLNHNYCDHVTVNSGMHILSYCTTIIMILVLVLVLVLRYASFCDFSQFCLLYCFLLLLLLLHFIKNF